MPPMWAPLNQLIEFSATNNGDRRTSCDSQGDAMRSPTHSTMLFLPKKSLSWIYDHEKTVIGI